MLVLVDVAAGGFGVDELLVDLIVTVCVNPLTGVGEKEIEEIEEIEDMFPSVVLF